MFDNASFEVGPALGALVALERIGGREARVADFKILFEVFNQTAPVDNLLCLDQLEQFAKKKHEFCLSSQRQKYKKISSKNKY